MDNVDVRVGVFVCVHALCDEADVADDSFECEACLSYWFGCEVVERPYVLREVCVFAVDAFLEDACLVVEYRDWETDRQSVV